MKGIKPYKKYKASSITWLGDIPEHWERWKLNRLLFFQEGPGLRNWQFKDTGVKVICVTNIVPPRIDFSKMTKYISKEEYHEKYEHFTVENGDVLLASSGASWGKVSTFFGDEKLILNTSTIRLKSKNQLLSNVIIKHLLNAPYVNTQLQNLLTGSCQPNFGPTHLDKLYIALPTIEEQTAIAHFLDYKTAKIDRFIHKKKQLIKLLNEQKAGIINDAVTKGLNPNAKTKPSGIEWLGDIPEHWEVVKLTGLCDLVRGNSSFKKDELLSEGKYVALQYGKTYKVNEVDENFQFYVNDEFYKDAQIVNIGDVILVSTSETMQDLGHSVFYNRHDLGLIGGEQILLKPNTDDINGKYLYYSSKLFSKALRKYATGVKVYRFNVQDLKKIYTPVPPILEQTAIVAHIEKETAVINKTIATIEKEIALVQEYRTALIAEAVTGKIDVSNYELGDMNDELEETESVDLKDEAEFDNQEME